MRTDSGIELVLYLQIYVWQWCDIDCVCLCINLLFAISKICGKSACSIFEQSTPNFNDVCFTSKRNVGLEKGSARYFSACKENKSSKEWFFNILFLQP